MALEIEALSKRYPDFFLDLNLRVDDELLVLAGPSGCGKSTALRLIAGLIPADSGSVRLDGRDITAEAAWKRDTALVFQDLALFPHLSVAGNIAFASRVRNRSRQERQEIVERELALVRLSGFGSRRVQSLSGGERQRVAIARALASEPRVLLMDEPFSSLDGPLREQLRTEVRELRKKTGIPCVFVTHDREEAAALGDRIALMDSGRIVECATGAELFTRPRTAFAVRFLDLGTVLPADCLPEALARAVTPRLDLKSGETALFIPRDAVVVAQDASQSEPLSKGEPRRAGTENQVVYECAQVEVISRSSEGVELSARLSFGGNDPLLKLRVKRSPGMERGETIRLGFLLDRLRTVELR